MRKFAIVTGGNNLNDRLCLKTPLIDALDFRRELLSDFTTMDYNKGYGKDGTGCYYLTDRDVRNWYSDWFGKPTDIIHMQLEWNELEA